MTATYLGLDLGTTAAKGVVLSADGQVLARARVPHSPVPDAGTYRVHPRTWALSLRAVCRQLSGRLDGISAVGIATHCPAVVPLDDVGRPVGPAVTWQAPELPGYLTSLAGRRTPDMIAATGNHPAVSTTMALAYHYLRDHDPEAFSRVGRLGFVGTWLGAQLTGVLATDPTQASYSGVYDVVTAAGGWLPAAVEELGVDGSVLPPVRGPLEVLGTAATPFAVTLGLPAGIPVVVGSADTPAAAHALGHQPFLSLGTTHVVSGARSTPDLRARVLQRRGIRDGQWLVNGVFGGGTALAAAAERAGFSGPGGVTDLLRCASEADARTRPAGLVFVPHVSPERGPFWFDRPAAAVVGRTPDTTLSQLATALVDGIAFADRLVLEATLGRADDILFLTGAYSDDLLFPQRVCDLSGRSFRVLTEPDLPAVGVAMMAAEAVAGMSVSFEPATTLLAPRTEPDAVERAWSDYLDAWARVTGTEPASILHSPTAAPAAVAEPPTERPIP